MLKSAKTQTIMQNQTLDPETLYFAISTSSKMLKESAETVQGVRLTADSAEDMARVTAMLNSCVESAQTLLDALSPMEPEVDLDGE